MMARHSGGDNSDSGLLSVEAPGGWKGRLEGIDTKAVLLGLLLLATSIMVGYQWHLDRLSDEEARKGYLNQHKITQELLKNVIANQKAIIDMVGESRRYAREDIGEMTYILTLSQQRREGLQLEMPQSLRQRLTAGNGLAPPKVRQW